MRRARVAIWLVLLATAGAAPIAAHNDDDECRIKEITSVSPLTANAGTYTMPQMPAAQAVTITIAFKTRHRGTCRGAIAFSRPNLPATMSPVGGGGGKLPYTILSAAGGGKQLIFTGIDPGSNRLDFTVHGNAHSVTLTVYVLMQPGLAAVPAGSYADHGLTLHVFSRSDWNLRLVGSRPFAVIGTVAPVCLLPAPDIKNLNFNSAISNGLPNPAIVFTANFQNVSCTAPARIRLSGTRLEPSSPIVPVANFDNFIHWRAGATFGAASVELSTKAANQATSAVQNMTSGAISGAVITVNVNLLQGQRVIAGTYSGVLTVTIDPSL